jgi:hypothetical protein
MSFIGRLRVAILHICIQGANSETGCEYTGGFLLFGSETDYSEKISLIKEQ